MANLPNLSGREVIIGSGVHATVYAATRVQMGFPRPVMLERDDRPGGMFSRYTTRFWLNSVNAGSLDSTSAGPTRIPSRSPSDDLNWLPNCQFQVASVCGTEYPDNKTVGQTVRRNADKYADVYTGCEATLYDVFGYPTIEVDGTRYNVPRLIDARGLRHADAPNAKAGTPVITADHFLSGQLPATIADGTPKSVAIIGDGDSACIVAEALLGQGPDGRPFSVSRLGWYGQNLPSNNDGEVTKNAWLRSGTLHARYLGLARHLPQAGVTGMIEPFRVRAEAASLGSTARVSNRTYDLAVYCTGYVPAFTDGEPVIRALDQGPNRALWRSNGRYFAVGPCAGIAYSNNELAANLGGYTRFPRNTAAIFRLAPATAQLAATLPECGTAR